MFDLLIESVDVLFDFILLHGNLEKSFDVDQSRIDEKNSKSFSTFPEILSLTKANNHRWTSIQNLMSMTRNISIRSFYDLALKIDNQKDRHEEYQSFLQRTLHEVETCFSKRETVMIIFWWSNEKVIHSSRAISRSNEIAFIFSNGKIRRLAFFVRILVQW